LLIQIEAAITSASRMHDQRLESDRNDRIVVDSGPLLFVQHLVDVGRTAPLSVRCGLGCGFALLAIFIRSLLTPVWGESLRLIMFSPAVLVSAWLGGLGAGLTATGVCVAAAWYVWLPPGRVAHETAALITFVVEGAMTSAILEALHRTRRRVEEQSRSLARKGAALAQSMAAERDARSAAEAANRTKDDFLATLSHELRNPLAAISAAIRVLDRDTQPGVAARARRVITRQTEFLSRMIEDLLDTGRMMAGKIRLQRQCVDLSDVVLQCVATLKDSGVLDAHVLSVSASPVLVDADAIRLGQITVNLVTNAVKYTPSGGTIRIVVSQEATEAVLVVQDSGVGIASGLLPRVFDLFVQGEAASDRGRGGLGIGLSVVRGLIELHGGTVQAASDGLGRGSTFTVRLPRVAGGSNHPDRRLDALRGQAQDRARSSRHEQDERNTASGLHRTPSSTPKLIGVE
jgi:signal transduction histidine kinase